MVRAADFERPASGLDARAAEHEGRAPTVESRGVARGSRGSSGSPAAGVGVSGGRHGQRHHGRVGWDRSTGRTPSATRTRCRNRDGCRRAGGARRRIRATLEQDGHRSAGQRARGGSGGEQPGRRYQRAQGGSDARGAVRRGTGAQRLCIGPRKSPSRSCAQGGSPACASHDARRAQARRTQARSAHRQAASSKAGTRRQARRELQSALHHRSQRKPCLQAAMSLTSFLVSALSHRGPGRV